MKAESLRIGNYVEILGCNRKLDTSLFISRLRLNPQFKDCKPIPLTEEWLVKFGFKNKTVLEFIDRYFIDEFSVDYNRTHKYYHFNVGYEFNVEIDHIHELQNLHFSLTGEELC